MALRKSLKCPKCDRMFSRPGPLAWHMTAKHGIGGKKKSGRRALKKTRVRRMPRTNIASSRLGLGQLSLEHLRDLIDAAKVEAKRRLVQLQAAFR